MIDIDWRGIGLVVFDVDGTLYDQRCLRPRMIGELLSHCFRHPTDLRVLRLIAEFRRCREQLAEAEAEGVDELQFQLPAERLGMEPSTVRRTLESWMLERPLRYLAACRFPDVERFFAALRAADVTVAVLSDYPAGDKLAALGLQADLLVSAVDPKVDRLKPHPRGLQRVLELSRCEADQAVLIGDRDDRDGESARRAGVRYLLKVPDDRRGGPFFRGYADLLSSFVQRPAEDAALQ